VDGLHVEQLVPFRGLVRASKVLGGNGLGEVEERAGNRRHRDRVYLGAVVGVDLACAMDRDPRAATAASTRDRDVDRAAVGLPEIPEHGRVAMAEEGALAAGKYGGHPVALAVKRAERVDASVNSPQAPICHPSPDRGRLDPQGSELPHSHHSMLSARKPADDGVEDTHRPVEFEGG
jgi:hypothetical protein